MTEHSANSIENIQPILNGRTHRAERSVIGQFLTPAVIADFMASLFEPNRLDHLRILDAGAGEGSLFSAYVKRLVLEDRRPLSICVVAYENDRRI